MIATGLDRVLQDPSPLAGRTFALLAHRASVSADLLPAHLALARAGRPPARLLGPEHGFHGVEQDMVPSHDEVDPWTGVEIVSLYGEDAASLKPRPEVFEGIDLVLVDLQDVGSRYYTYAATAIWSAAAALSAGVETWILDRPNPLGGVEVEGSLLDEAFTSFVGAFPVPARHGLTLGELARLELERQGADLAGLRVFEVEGWRREMTWPALERPWISPSPNMPDFETALLYPGMCLLEATEFSEGRGTTRPFRIFGAPGIDPVELARSLHCLEECGVAALPTYFRPGYQKHSGALCGGVELVVVEPRRVRGLRLGVEVMAALRTTAGETFRWRAEPYEFVGDRPAIDLLAGCDRLRKALDGDGGLEEWVASWPADEAAFRVRRAPYLLYAEGEE